MSPPPGGASAPPLRIPRRFCGPPSSGNGGWTAGALAARLSEPGDGVASHEGTTVAEAVRVPDALSPVPPVALATAAEVSTTYPGLHSHPFATCFVCGTARREGDGLRIFPGPLAEPDAGTVRVAAPWTPHPSLADATGQTTLPIAWAALDCAGAWACDLTERLMVLGQMTARVDRLPAIGAPHVVVAEHRGDQGRKSLSAVSLYDAEGRLLALAEQIWITVDPGQFG